MFIIKIIISVFIVYICTYLGIYKARTYEIREKELKNIKSSLNMLKSKIEFTYEPIKEIFIQISKIIYEDKNNIFLNVAYFLENMSSNEAWYKAIEENKNLKIEDKEILKMFGKLLGKTDKKGQISEIELTQNFLEKQIEKAENEKNKNAKLYKTLGTLSGIGIIIILA